MEIAVDAQGNVRQYGSGIGTPEGCTLVELTDAQAAALLALTGQANGGLTYVNGVFVALPVPPPPAPPPDANQALLEAIANSPDWPTAQQKITALLQQQPPVAAV